MQQDASAVYPASYAAFFAPRTHKFDTVDFRLPATPHNLRTYIPKTTPARRTISRHAGLLGLLIGLLVAVLGFAVDQATRGLTFGLYTLTTRLSARSLAAAAVVFPLLSALYVLVPAALVIFVAPLGAGSGIPELKAYLNGVRVPAFLSLPTLAVKTLGVAFSVASGLVCGKQGPIIHAGAIVGAAVSQAASTTFHTRLNFALFRPFRTEAWKRDFTAVGAAVGVAVAFGSPMGAWMWVYEEACTHWTWQLGIITLSACLSGAAVARILNFLASGLPGGGFGMFTLTQVGKLVTPFPGTSFPIKDLPAFIVIGVLGGVVGALIPIINKSITLSRYKYVTKPFPRLAETLLIALLTAVVRIIIPYLASDCRPVDDAFVNVLSNAPLRDYSRYVCEEGHFSPWAAVLFNPSDSVLRALLFDHISTSFTAGPLITALAFYFVFIVWTYGIAVPAGVFFPVFLLGSLYGRLMGVIVQAIFHSRTDLSLTGYAFVGGVSALAGLTRTISVAVIAIEATGNESASFATVLVALIAKLVGDFLYARGIYDLHIDLKGIPFLESAAPFVEQYSHVRVSEVMESSVMGVRRRSRVSSLLNMLRSNEHHAFPVFLKVSTSGGDNMRTVGTGLSGVEGSVTRAEVSVSQLKTTGPGDAAMQDGDTTDEDETHTGRDLSPQRSTIITPTGVGMQGVGMQATIFDDGRRHVVWMPNRSEQWVESVVVRAGSNGEAGSVGGEGDDRSSGIQASSAMVTAATATTKSAVALEGNGGRKGGDMATRVNSKDGEEVLDYQLMGTVDRATLLVLLKHECDKRELFGKGEAALQIVSREELDAAWPNPSRLKGDEEAKLIQRVHDVGVLDVAVDLTDFTDPDPVMISDRAPSSTAYRMFRSTGTRHILVANMRSGRICGILTRKDILPDSISEVVGRREALDSIKVE